jgi:hypothetical protein
VTDLVTAIIVGTIALALINFPFKADQLPLQGRWACASSTANHRDRHRDSHRDVARLACGAHHGRTRATTMARLRLDRPPVVAGRSGKGNTGCSSMFRAGRIHRRSSSSVILMPWQSLLSMHTTI